MNNTENILAQELKNKQVVVDTSSLLNAGLELLRVIHDCTIIVPSAVVQELEEKRSHQRLGFIARQWLRLIEKLRVNNLKEISKGVVLEDYDNIVLRIEPNHTNQESLPMHLRNGSVDSTILSVAKNLKNEGAGIVLLSNDMPMRLHAGLDLGIDAYEYSVVKVSGSEPFDGVYRVELDPNDADEYFNEQKKKDYVLKKLYEEHDEDKLAYNAIVEVELGEGKKEYFTLSGDYIQPLKRKNKCMNITGRTFEQDAALYYLMENVEDLPIVSLGGKAGTGKTLLTMAVGLNAVRKYKKYEKLIVFRSLHEMGAGQELGFLPGTVEEKMASWGGAVWDAVEVLAKGIKGKGTSAEEKKKEAIKQLKDIVEVSPITYLRGRSLANSYIVVEEAQNFSRTELLNILSRVGEGSKIVFTFDSAQVDNRFLQSGSNADVWSVIDDLKSEELFGHVTLKTTERSRIAEIASSLLENNDS